MSRVLSFSDTSLELEEIAEHHADVESALSLYYGFSGEKTFLAAKFVGYTQRELSVEFEKRIDELERTSSLVLFSFLEAKFRLDYLQRCRSKKKDPLSRKFRAIYKRKDFRVSLEEDILQNWKEHHPEFRPLISELIGAFKYRHWLAHGRYWNPKLGRKYDYAYTYFLASQIYLNLL